jgi:hypothetical protein
VTPAEARSQAAAEWDALNLDVFDEDGVHRAQYPTLDHDGFPLDVDVYEDAVLAALTANDDARDEWIAARTAELLADAPRRVA